MKFMEETEKKIREALGERLITNWKINKVVARPVGMEVFVQVKCHNLDGIIFFDHIAKIEKVVTSHFKGAWNFSMERGTVSKPVVGFMANRV